MVERIIFKLIWKQKRKKKRNRKGMANVQRQGMNSFENGGMKAPNIGALDSSYKFQVHCGRTIDGNSPD